VLRWAKWQAYSLAYPLRGYRGNRPGGNQVLLPTVPLNAPVQLVQAFVLVRYGGIRARARSFGGTRALLLSSLITAYSGVTSAHT
jgi:hypothetical protein